MVSLLLVWAVLIKCAGLAPEYSEWGVKMKEASNEISKRTGGEVKVVWYLGSAWGDETDIARFLKQGKIDCAGMTGYGTGELIPFFRVVELPFLFKDYDEYDAVKRKVFRFFDKLARDKGVKLIWFAEVGFLYVFSKEDIATLDDLRGKRVWWWLGDVLQETIVEALKAKYGIVPVGLPLVEVEKNLDRIDLVYNSPYTLLALGWWKHFSWIIPVRFAFASGAILMNMESWKKIPEKHREVVRRILAQKIEEVSRNLRENDRKTMDFYLKNGFRFSSIPQSEVKKVEEYLKDTIYGSLSNRIYPSWLLVEILKTLTTLRVRGGG